MLYCDRIDLSKGIDVTKSSSRKECTICHYFYFKHKFKYEKSVCKDCHDLLILSLNISDITIITVKGIDYHCIISDTGNPTKFIC